MSEKCKETLAYERWARYRDYTLIRSQLKDMVDQSRAFYMGKQYSGKADGPQPVVNICAQAVNTISAKLTETPVHVNLRSSTDGASNMDMTEFYEFQKTAIGDSEFTERCTQVALIDGTCIAFTAYDEDTYGVKGKYRGYIKRHRVPVERCFFETIKVDDVQDVKYLGYAEDMSVREAKRLYQGKDKKALDLVIANDCTNADGTIDFDRINNDSDRVTVVTMFSRDDEGEVFWTVSTRYVELIPPHYLSTDKTKAMLGEELHRPEETTRDYEKTSEGKYMEFTPPKLANDEDKRPDFGRYPVSVYAPYPVEGTFLGQSLVQQLMPNQKTINYGYVMTTRIIQSNSAPKILVKEGALKGQVISNKPGQVLVDYTPYGYNSWGITNMQGAMGSVNNEILNFSRTLMADTRQVNGFDSLTADTMGANTSGYAYQQLTRQMNLPLQIPQKRLWSFIGDLAKTDMLYFRFYVGECRFLVDNLSGYNERQEAQYGMAQSMLNSGYGAEGFKQGDTLPQPTETEEKTMTNLQFRSDWDIVIETEEGVAGSQATEGQHWEQMAQYLIAGNMDASMAKSFVACHPALSLKTKTNFKMWIEAYEQSQLAQVKAENDQLKQMIEQQNNTLADYAQQIEYINMRANAQQKAFNDQNKTNQAMVQMFADQAKTEGEVKSNNSRGIEGTLFQ